jgi:CDP-glycerol glycerophosphotransferase (TagB/SpsB family)
VGAPQFDVFFQDRFYLSREAFCQSQGLRADLPIIVYAVGSPNFLRGEPRGALDFARRVMRGDLGNVQVIVRPHPLHDKGELSEMFREFSPKVVLQRQVASDSQLLRSQNADHITEWVNTFKHADVVINLSSTVTVDAAIFDRPVVNLDYDPAAGAPQQQLIKDVNHTWHHFKPIAESGGLWLVNNPDEMVDAVKAYLGDPGLHREKRRWIAEYVCQYLDGRCGERMAEAVLDFAQNRLYRSSKPR